MKMVEISIFTMTLEETLDVSLKLYIPDFY